MSHIESEIPVITALMLIDHLSKPHVFKPANELPVTSTIISAFGVLPYQMLPESRGLLNCCVAE